MRSRNKLNAVNIEHCGFSLTTHKEDDEAKVITLQSASKYQAMSNILLAMVDNKGRSPIKKNVYFRALPESGGDAPARKFWPSFYQVLIPKISQYLL